MKVINIVRVCLVLAAFACVCSAFGVQGIVHAQEETLSPTSTFIAKYFDKFISVILPSIVSAIGISYLGYKKSHVDGDYDKTRLIYTVLAAIIASLLTTFAGMTYADLAKYGVDGLVTIVLYWLAQWLSPHLGFIPATNPSGTPTTPPVVTPPVVTPLVVTPPAVIVIPPYEYPVKVGDSFTNNEISALLEAGYTKWLFPSGITPEISLPSPPCLGIKLTADGWIGIMPEGWRPVDTHPSG